MEFKGTKGKWESFYNIEGFITSIKSKEADRTIFTSRVNNMIESNANMVLAASAPEMFEFLLDMYEQEQCSSQSCHDELFELLTKITQ